MSLLTGTVALSVLCFAALGRTILSDYVDTRVGSGSAGQIGNTFPATGTPFANTFITPQTQPGENKCVSPYYSWDTQISGFRASHWVSGSCMKDYGSVTLMPYTGALPLNVSESSYASAFRKVTEISTPYRYAVTLDRYNISVEASGLSHTSALKVAFPPSGSCHLLIKPNNQFGQGEIVFDMQETVTVKNPVHRLYAQSGQPAGYSSHYSIRLPPSKVTSCTAMVGQSSYPNQCWVNATGSEVALILHFSPAAQSSHLEVFLGHSFTNSTLAEANLQAQLATAPTFDDITATALASWESALASITIEGATKDNLTTFYTAMYHSLLHPRQFSDLSSNTHVMFNSNATHAPVVDSPTPYYDDFSMWDIYRVVMPFISIVAPTHLTSFARSLVTKYREGGWLPVFPCWNSYTNEMVGDHSIVVLIDSIAKGLFPETDGFTLQEVFEAGWKNALQTPSNEETQNGCGRRSVAAYIQNGYVPLDTDTGKNQQVSISLEYAYDDFALAQLAKRLDHHDQYLSLINRSESWRNLMDNSTGSWYVRGRWANRSFVNNFDPFAGAPGHGGPPSYITEDSVIEYTFFVPHNVPGLQQLFGGSQALVDKLRFFFEGGYYNAGNEPDIQVPYMFNFAGAAWLTQKWVATLTQRWYGPTANGLPGNDDAGAMSSWYIFSSLGFYPVCLVGAATSGPKYLIGTPQFARATVNVSDGKQLIIEASGVSRENFFIQSATWNGEDFSRSWITHTEIMGGGLLRFEMGPLPNVQWGAGAGNFPTEC